MKSCESERDENYSMMNINIGIMTQKGKNELQLTLAGMLITIVFFMADLNLKTGIIIPAGAIIVVPVQLVQLNKSCWGADADQFNPYRFVSQISQQEFNVGDKHTSVEDSVRGICTLICTASKLNVFS